jgi:hypothetical protein
MFGTPMIVAAYNLCGIDELTEMDPDAQRHMIKTQVAYWLEDFNFLFGRLNGVSSSLFALLPCAHAL